MSFIAAGVDATGGAASYNTAILVWDPEAFSITRLQDGITLVESLCSFITPEPPPTPTPLPTGEHTPGWWTITPSYTPLPSVTPSGTPGPEGWYCILVTKYATDDCTPGEGDVSVINCIYYSTDPTGEMGCFPDSETGGTYKLTLLGGPYETSVECQGSCATPSATPSPSVQIPCCGPVRDEGPFESLEEAESYGSYRPAFTIPCSELGDPDCTCGDGCHYQFNTAVELDGNWYARYNCDLPDCHDCTPTPTTTPPTPVECCNPEFYTTPFTTLQDAEDFMSENPTYDMSCRAKGNQECPDEYGCHYTAAQIIPVWNSSTQQYEYAVQYTLTSDDCLTTPTPTPPVVPSHTPTHTMPPTHELTPIATGDSGCCSPGFYYWMQPTEEGALAMMSLHPTTTQFCSSYNQVQGCEREIGCVYEAVGVASGYYGADPNLYWWVDYRLIQDNCVRNTPTVTPTVSITPSPTPFSPEPAKYYCVQIDYFGDAPCGACSDVIEVTDVIVAGIEGTSCCASQNGAYGNITDITNCSGTAYGTLCENYTSNVSWIIDSSYIYVTLTTHTNPSFGGTWQGQAAINQPNCAGEYEVAMTPYPGACTGTVTVTITIAASTTACDGTPSFTNYDCYLGQYLPTLDTCLNEYGLVRYTLMSETPYDDYEDCITACVA